MFIVVLLSSLYADSPRVQAKRKAVDAPVSSEAPEKATPPKEAPQSTNVWPSQEEDFGLTQLQTRERPSPAVGACHTHIHARTQAHT